MSIYMMAAQQGISSLELMATGENAQTRAAYNEAYNVAAKKAAIREARHTAQLNISAIEQDKITSNTRVRMAQDQAKAMAIVNAAAVGIEGGSFEDMIYETEKNEAFALSSMSKKAEQAQEGQLAAIGSQTSNLLSIQEPEISYTGELLAAFSSFELGDLEISEAISSGEGLSQLWSK